MYLLLLLIVVILFLLLASVESSQKRRVRRIRIEREEDCTDKPFILDGRCVEDCPSFINENNIDCIDYIPEGKYLLGNKIVSKCPMYYTNTRLCGYPKAEFVSSVISNDGKYKTLITRDGIVVSFNGLEWCVYNHSNNIKNVSKLLSNDTGNKQLVMTLNGVFISTDYGKTWSLLLPQNVKVIDVDMSADGIITLIIDRSVNSTEKIRNVEVYKEDGTTMLVKSFINILITQISIGKFQSSNFTNYFAVLRAEDNKCFIIKSIFENDRFNSSNSQLNNTFIINFYYSFDDIRTEPYEGEAITYIEMSKNGRFIYVITKENKPMGRCYLYTGLVLGPAPNSNVYLYRSNIDVGNLVYMKSSYHGKNNIGIVYNQNTKSEYLLNFDIVYNEEIVYGNPLLVSARLNTDMKGFFTAITVSIDQNQDNDGKYNLACLSNGEIIESKDYGMKLETMK